MEGLSTGWKRSATNNSRKKKQSPYGFPGGTFGEQPRAHPVDATLFNQMIRLLSGFRVSLQH